MSRTYWLLAIVLWPLREAIGQLVPPPPPDSISQSMLTMSPAKQLSTVMTCLQPARPARTAAQLTHNQHLFQYLFAPTGYITVLTRQKTEVRLPASLMLHRCWRLSNLQYTFVKGRWSHVNAVSRADGNKMVRMITFPDVETFKDGYPQMNSRLSRVEVPIETDLPLPDYWQLVELIVSENDPVVTTAHQPAPHRHP